MSYTNALLDSRGSDESHETKNELRRARTRKKSLKLAELDALLPCEYRKRKQENGAGRRSAGLGGRTLEDVLQDTKRFLSEMSTVTRWHSAPAADQVERERIAAQPTANAEGATRHALESEAELFFVPWPPSLGSSGTTVEVNAEMRDGLLSSHSLMCIEIELSADVMSPWTVVGASQGTREFFEFAPWGELLGKDLLYIIHPADSSAFLSLDPRQRKGEGQDCYQHPVFVRFPRFSLHRFQFPNGVADEIETSLEMEMPLPPIEETDPLFEDETHATAFSRASVFPGGGCGNGGAGVFTASAYQAMRVSISGAGKTDASNLRALLVLEHAPPDKLEHSASGGGGRAGGGAGGGEIGHEMRTSAGALSEWGAEDAAAVESINAVLEALHAINGVYVWNPAASTSSPGAVRANLGMNVSPVTQNELNNIAHINQHINSWRQKGIMTLSNAVYRIVQMHVELRVESDGLPILNLHARLCIFGMSTTWKYLGRVPIDGSPVPFTNGPPNTMQMCTWAHEPEDEGGKVIALHRMLLVPAMLSEAFRFFSNALIFSQNGTVSLRGMLKGKMYENVFKKICEVDLVLCRANDEEQRLGFSVP